MSSLASRRNLKWGADRQRGAGNPNFSGGQYIDDKGYMRVSRGEHPNHNHGYVYMHRLVMEEHLGRILEAWEIVHHVNEVKLDNRAENLYLTTAQEHSVIHRTGKKASPENRKAKSIAAKERNKTMERTNGGKFIKAGEKKPLDTATTINYTDDSESGSTRLKATIRKTSLLIKKQD